MTAKEQHASTRTRWSLLLTRLPLFPAFVAVFLTVTVLFFSFAPHQYRKLPSGISQSRPQRPIVTSHGDRQNSGQIRTCEAPRHNVWRELSEIEANDVVRFVEDHGKSAGTPANARM